MVSQHPGLTFLALVGAMLAGSISVSSVVGFVLVERSWLGLESPAGLGLSVVCSVLALVAVAFLVFVCLSAGYGEDDSDDDDDGRGGDDWPPAPEGPSGEPVWWPEFEREFAEHLREPTRTPTTIGSGSGR